MEYLVIDSGVSVHVLIAVLFTASCEKLSDVVCVGQLIIRSNHIIIIVQTLCFARHLFECPYKKVRALPIFLR